MKKLQCLAMQARCMAQRDQAYAAWSRRNARRIAGLDGGLADFVATIAEIEAQRSGWAAEQAERSARP